MDELQQRINAGEIDPLCPSCGGFLKAATILFGQRVPEPELARAKELAGACDLFLVVGSSLKVSPAAMLPRLALKRNIPLIIINLEPTSFDEAADVFIAEKAGVILPRLVEML
jgi:NAD-dependent deacetylase